MHSAKMATSVGLIGFGCALPPHVRTSDDPIFDLIRSKTQRQSASDRPLFPPFKERRYLKPGESLEELMILAGRNALSNAKISPAEIDRLYGYSSVSEYLLPNGLFKVHQGLGLPSRTMVVPVDTAYTNFILGTIVAWEAILADHCRYAMINCGSGWTRNSDYGAPYSLVMGDGAGAAILGPSERYTLIDFATSAFTEDDAYHGMTLKVRVQDETGARHIAVDERGLPVPTFAINESGVRAFLTQGMNELPRLVNSLLERHSIRSDEVAFITSQSSDVLMTHWAKAIKPKEYFETSEKYGNLTMAAIPVTLASSIEAITADYIVLATPGPGVNFAVLLIKR